MNRKSKLLVAMVLVAFMVTFAYAKNEPNPVTYTDHQRFRSDVTIDAPNSSNPSDVTVGPNAAVIFSDGSGVTISGDFAFGTTYSLFLRPVFVSFSGTSYYTLSKDNGSLFWLDTVGHQDGTRAATSGVSIILPKITAAYHGYTFRVRDMNGLYSLPGASGATVFSGTTPIVFTTTKWSSGTTDHIWTGTVGNGFSSGATFESTTQVVPEYQALTAVGSWVQFTAFYHASGSTWYLSGCSL